MGMLEFVLNDWYVPFGPGAGDPRPYSDGAGDDRPVFGSNGVLRPIDGAGPIGVFDRKSLTARGTGRPKVSTLD